MIRDIALFDFRNYHERSFRFTSDRVVFFGPNGVGKTNILEALFILSMGKGWREKSNQELIRHTEHVDPNAPSQASTSISSAMIQAHDDQDTFFKVMIDPRSRSFFRHEKKISLKKHFGTLPTLLFAPEHLVLFLTGKRERQKFFDRFLFQLSPTYRDNLRRCQKAVRQRNSLLKSSQEQPPTNLEELLAPWNHILSETIPAIIEERQSVLTKINPLVQEKMAEISGKGQPLRIELQVGETYEPTQQGVLSFFHQKSSRELGAGRTLIGPHRDDFVFFLRDYPITQTASRGEERSVLLSLLAAKKELFQQVLERSPLILMDDVFSELDQERQTRLEHLCQGSQVFFTTTHQSHFDDFKADVQKFAIEETS